MMENRDQEKKPIHLEKHVHVKSPFPGDDAGQTKAVLVGNPNVGKSLLFNEMSGLYVDVSNYPGTTIQVSKGTFGTYTVYATPGIYGVSSFSEEERVALDIILEADVILNIVDGTHLERDLFLTQQLIDMGKRITVLLNFMDEVETQKIVIDVPKLAHFLGVAVIPITAVKGVGRETIEKALRSATEGVQREELHSMLHTMLSRVGSQAEALLVLEEDKTVAERHGVSPGNHQEEIYVERRNRVNYVLNQVLQDDHAVSHVLHTIGRWAMTPLTGIPMLLAVLYATYVFVGQWVAGDLVGFTEIKIGQGLWEPWIRSAVASVIGESWLNEILVGEFGVFTMTVTYVLFLLLPLVGAFHLMLSMLEDSGYLPRLATMVDRSLAFLGLNGRAVIPIILGFGCITSATITTRLLTSEKEKTIATAILQFVIPCSAQMAVIAALLAGAGFAPVLLYIGVMLCVLVAAGTILNKTLKGESQPLLLDLPPLRLPRPSNVLRKTSIRTYHFMKEATGWFFVGALAVSVAQLTGVLRVLVSALKPLVVHWLQLPPEAATAFVMGVVRRDFGAAGLYHMSLTPLQIVVALITITLFVPCIASLIVMMKERGLKEGTVIWISTFVGAFAVAGIVSHIVM